MEDSFRCIFDNLENTKICIEDTKYSISDVFGCGDEEMSMSFSGKTEIILYGAFDSEYADSIIRGEAKLKTHTKLYEYDAIPYLIHNENTFSKESAVLKIAVDIKGCLDTLNMSHLKKLQDTYKIMKEKSLIDTKDIDIDRQIINRFIAEARKKNLNINCIRQIIHEGKSIYPKSTFNERAYIVYTILDDICIKHTEKITK